MSDYYTTLGVTKNSSPEEIKKAYRKLAHQHHPDKQGGDEKKFKEINEAYQVLSDPEKRAQYDQFGSAPPGGFGSQGPFGGFSGGFNQEVNLEDLFDLFGGAFGGGFRQSGGRGNDQASGGNIKIAMTLTLKDVARGAVKNIELNRDLACNECGGSGGAKGKGLVDCPACNGRGEVRETSASFFGNITRVAVCRVCHGIGKVPKENCRECKGEGIRKSKKSLDLEIPSGLKNGEVLFVKGEGNAGFRAVKSGDLYVEVRVEQDSRFKRVGNDLVYDLPLKLTDALLGAKLRVPTIDGEKEIDVPAGIQSGEEIKLSGLGIWGKPRGDEVVKINILIPKKLNNKAKKLVEELEGELTT
ncbi:MAG TPA: DnaJ C-terminal domain-containing protein [Candidatus Paceibacterota bacterium]